MMVEAGAKEVSEEEIVQALEHAHAAISEIVAGIDALARDAGKTKTEVKTKEIAHDVLPRGRGEGLRAARRGDAHQGQARELRQRRPGARRARRQHSRRRDRAQRADAKAIFKELKEKVMRDEALERGKRLDGRAFDEIRPISIEVGVLPRTHGSAVFTARRDPGARDRDARHRRRPAEDRDGRRRDLEALHAALQLPAVLGRRSAVPARPRPPRDRPRRARRARARADDSQPKRSSPTPSASSPTSSSRTARRRWRRCAAARSR